MKSPDVQGVEYYKTLYFETLDEVEKYEKEVDQKLRELQLKNAEKGKRIGELLNRLEKYEPPVEVTKAKGSDSYS